MTGDDDRATEAQDMLEEMRRSRDDLRLCVDGMYNVRDHLIEALRANVMDRRNKPGGCCDWSCPLCAPLAEWAP